MKITGYVLVVAYCLISFISTAQGVGVNPTGAAPSDVKAMLEVRKPGYSKLKIRTESYASDTSVLELSNRTPGNTGTDILFSLLNEEGLLVTSASDWPGNKKDSLFSLKINGSMGVGIKNPANTFHLHTPGSAINLMSITTNATGVSTNDGLLIGMSGGNGVINNMEGTQLRLGTGNFTRLAIDGIGNVGIGNLTPAYKLDVNGDVNVTGVLRINGSSGAAGQVLTSNGTSDPVWRTTALSNNTRFAVNFAKSLSSANDFARFTTTKYNLNTTDVSIVATGVTINKSGLYHFDIHVEAGANFPSAPIEPPQLFLELFTSPNGYEIVSNKVMSAAYPNNFAISEHHSIEVYIIAPYAVKLYHGYGLTAGAATTAVNGYLIGHLISE